MVSSGCGHKVDSVGNVRYTYVPAEHGPIAGRKAFTELRLWADPSCDRAGHQAIYKSNVQPRIPLPRSSSPFGVRALFALRATALAAPSEPPRSLLLLRLRALCDLRASALSATFESPRSLRPPSLRALCYIFESPRSLRPPSLRALCYLRASALSATFESLHSPRPPSLRALCYITRVRFAVSLGITATFQ